MAISFDVPLKTGTLKMAQTHNIDRRLGQVGQHPVVLFDQLVQQNLSHVGLVILVVSAVEVLEVDACNIQQTHRKATKENPAFQGHLARS